MGIMKRHRQQVYRSSFAPAACAIGLFLLHSVAGTCRLRINDPTTNTVFTYPLESLDSIDAFACDGSENFKITMPRSNEGVRIMKFVHTNSKLYDRNEIQIEVKCKLSETPIGKLIVFTLLGRIFSVTDNKH